MLAALLGWGRRPLPEGWKFDGGAVNVTREVDGGLQTIEVKPAGRGHRRPAPERAALCLAAQHHEGQEKPLDEKTARPITASTPPAPEGRLKTTGPRGRKAGVKVGSVAELVGKRKL